MAHKTITAAGALKNAASALQRGDKTSARYWAQQAASLDRRAAEPWLMLARVSGPRARAAYLEMALKAQPENPEARKAVRHSQIKARKPAARPPRRAWPSCIASVAFLAAALAVAAAFWCASPAGLSVGKAMISALPGIFTDRSAGQRGFSAAAATAGPDTALSSLPAAVSSPTAALWATATYTPFPAQTFTPTPIPTSTPTSTPSPTPTFTDAPTAVDTPAPAGPPPPGPEQGGGKSIVVSISEQQVYAYEGGTLVFRFVASTGRGNGTPAGSFQILDKIPNAYSYPWGFWMPDWMGFAWVGSDLEDGFHSLPVLPNGQTIWGDAIGTPITYGCVVLQPGDMQQLFNWADIGTPVEIVP